MNGLLVVDLVEEHQLVAGDHGAGMAGAGSQAKDGRKIRGEFAGQLFVVGDVA